MTSLSCRDIIKHRHLLLAPIQSLQEDRAKAKKEDNEENKKRWRKKSSKPVKDSLRTACHHKFLVGLKEVGWGGVGGGGLLEFSGDITSLFCLCFITHPTV